ncbi:MAG TPA: helix-hairpin-helix domain-containing protein [Ktedonobacteraceae bacterium]|nr:helix-hairpin-helix domain-containing protein [Ktedonobacteraceae bacterium]
MIQLTQTIQFVPPTLNRHRKGIVQPMLPGMEPEEVAPTIVTNRQIAEVLSSIADLLEFQNANPYRIQAYRNAARAVLDMTEPVASIVERGEELNIPGIGERMRGHIAELVEHGTVTFCNDIATQTLPPEARALMAIEYVGPHTAIRLYEELGIDSPEKLYRAAQQQRIRQLSGFGPRSEARLRDAVARYRASQQPTELDGVA